MLFRILTAVVLVSALFFLAVAVFALSGVDIPQSGKDFFGIAPDWISALATAATGAVAFIAYLEWRRPDDTRRQADAAQHIMMLSQRFETLFIAGRSPILTWDINDPTAETTDIDLIDLMSSAAADREENRNGQRERLQDARLAGLELFSYRSLARGMLSEEIAGEIEALYQMFEGVELAYIMAEEYRGKTVSELGDLTRLALRMNLRALGYRHGDPSGDAVLDPFEDEIKVRGDRLRMLLVPFLVQHPNRA